MHNVICFNVKYTRFEQMIRLSHLLLINENNSYLVLNSDPPNSNRPEKACLHNIQMLGILHFAYVACGSLRNGYALGSG